MSLYHKYRPQSFDEIIGNQSVVSSVKTMINRKTSHAYLFTGPTGCGKTTMGRIIAREIGAVGSDFVEVDSADFRGIDTIREIRRRASYKPLNGNAVVYLLDEVHKLSNDAMNALLKLLEDTPEYFYLILATTEPEKLIKTIKGRCSIYEMKPLSDKEMFQLLRKVVKAEGEHMSKNVYQSIISKSAGLPRNSLQLLQQVLMTEEDLREEIAEKNNFEETQSIELCRALINQSSWKKIANILDGLKGQDPEKIRRHVLGYTQSVLLSKDDRRLGLILEMFVDPFYNSGFPGLVFACYSVIKS